MFDFIDDFQGEEAIYPQQGLYIPEATDCMRCGLCISVCPTYKLFQSEAETPRSRLRSIDKIINGNTPVSGEELKHLNNCTQCRACETTCPSKMAYGHLFDLAREKLFQASPSKQPRNILAVMGFKLIEHKSWLTAATIVMGLYQKIGLQFLIRKTGLLHVFKLKRAEALMPKVALTKLAERYPTAQQHRGNVALFTGCISDHFDRKTLLASIKLLNRIGFDVFVPKQQTCCGAIHLHQGQKDIADKIAALNTDVFNSLDIKAIIYTASGCGLTLTEYEHEKDDDQKFGNSLYDITEFLNLHWQDTINLKEPSANAKKIAVHEPCSQHNVTPVTGNRHQHVYTLLEKIPGITVNLYRTIKSVAVLAVFIP